MKKTLTTLAIAGSLLSCSAVAEIHFNGFASIVGGATTSSNDSLYGYSDEFDFKQGSLFAIQASSDLEDGLGVTVQLTAKGIDDWDPEFKWAFVSYDVNDNLRILAGRQRAPFYMYSDFLDVSYAYPWISPPRGVYDLIFDTFDGLGAVYNTTFGDVDASFHGIYGRNTDDINALGQTSTPDINGMTGFSSTFNYDWLTLRGAYFVADVTIPFNDLSFLADGFNGFSQAVPQLAPTLIAAANNTVIEKDDASFMEFGFQMNFDELIIVGEITKLEIENTPLAEEKSYYLMAGYQFDSVLVHLTYGVDDNESNIYTSDIPYGLNSDLDQLKGGIENFVADQNSEERYIMLGARYEFHDSAALKFEYTDFSDKNNNNRDAGLFRVALVTLF
ncbi:MAG: porin [Thalassotalea sp.]